MASEIGVSVASDIVKSSLYAAIRQARYSICFNKYVEDLGKEKKKLMLTRESVQERKEKAIQDTKKIDVVADEWLKDANTLIEEVDKLEQKVKTNKICCFGRCPNWVWRYHVGKQVVEKAKAVAELNQNSDFKVLALPATLPGMEYFSSEGFILFNSTKVANDYLLEALKDTEVSMIGLYGMGGCGKTTLVKQVGKEVEKDYNKVVFAVVSNTVDVRKIQGEIASYLGLKLEGIEALPERARRLWLSLTSGEKILIILDDVWEKLDFEVIGIPFGKNNKGCRVLLTTRRVQVCNLMGCQRTIPLSLLTEEEAWTLFQKHAGITDNTSDSLKAPAKEITKECKGLPIAIAAVAGSLKGKTLIEWKEALEKLKEAVPMDVEEGLKNPYNCLQLSYDNLNSAEAKSLFLLCSIFPEDFEIHEEYLARYGIGLGLFGEVGSYERARNQVSTVKNKLIDSCLLLKANTEQCVKMHDLVRDLALWIAKKENKVIMGPESSGRVLQESATFEANSLRYLWCDNVHKLPNQLHCSKLEFLYVNASKNLILPNGFFNGMEDLRVVVLRNESYWIRTNLTMEKSILSLTNLHCLFLEGWELDDISFVRSLKRLDALVLWHCTFKELPNEVTKLTKLRLVDLYSCKIEKNPYEVIGRCSQLEELYFVDNKGSGWEKEGQSAAEFLDKNNIGSVLERYRIRIGWGYSTFNKEDFSITRGLVVTNFDASKSNAAIKDLAQRAEFLGLYKIEKGCKNIIPDILEAIGGDMKEVREFRLWNSDEIECLVDTGNHSFNVQNAFSKLVKLDIGSMHHLETLWRGLKVKQLCSLKELKLYDCPMLTSVFTCDVAQSLELLEVIKITGCKRLKHIVTDEEKDTVDQKSSTSTSVFSKLRTLYVSYCNQLEYLIPVSFAGGLVQLESLRVENVEELIHVFGQSQFNHEDQNQNGFQIIHLPALKNLSLEYLPNMIGICAENYYPTWPSLEELTWYECPQLNVMSINKSIIAGSQVVTQQDSTPREGPRKFIGLENLQKLYIIQCNKLKCIFSTSIMGRLPQLEVLHVRDCNQLEQIFEDEEPPKVLNSTETYEGDHCLKNTSSSFVAIEEFPNTPQNPGTSICFSLYERLSRSLNFHNLKKEDERQKNKRREMTQNVHNLQSYIPMFPRLKDLAIAKCDLLKYTFSISFAQDLVKLEKMEIGKNLQLQYIFRESNQGNLLSNQRQNKIQIELPALKEMFVGFLPNIICPENFAFKCPSLQAFSLDSPQLKVKSLDSLINGSEVRISNHNSTQTSQEFMKGEIQLNEKDDSLQIIKQLQTLEVRSCEIDAIFQLEGFPITREQGPLIFSLSYLALDNLSELRFLCKGPIHSLNLKNLRQLFVSNCGKLKIMFSSSILRNFPQLEDLTIIQCDQMEQIIEEDENEQNLYNHPQVVCFPRLRQIYIEKCNNLKIMFSSSILRSFPQLVYLTIIQCDQMEQIIEEDEKEQHLYNLSQVVCFPRLSEIYIEKCNNLNYLFTIFSPLEFPQLYSLSIAECSLLEKVFAHEESDTQDGQTIRLPELGILRLIKLPNLITICKGFRSQSVYNLEVEDCPKFTSTKTSHFEDMPQEYQNQVEEEDKESKREEEEVKVGNMNVIEQSTTSCLESRDTDLQTSTNEDFNLSAPLAATNQEYQTSEEGGNQKKMQNRNVIEQSTTSYSENREAHKTQTQGFDISINNFDTQQRLQEQNINFRENMKESTKESHQKGLAPEKSTKATSSLDFVIEEPMSGLVLMDRQEGLEQNQVTIEFLDKTDVTSEVVHNAIELTNNSVPIASTSKQLQEVARSSPISQSSSSIANAAGEATLELLSSVPVAFEENKVPVGDLPSDLNLDNETKQWDNFDCGLGPSSSLEVKPNKVAQSVQDYQERELQTQTMTRHRGELQTQEIHQEQKMPQISSVNKGQSVKGKEEEIAQKDPTSDKPKLPISPLELVKNSPQSELALMDQQYALEENKTSRKLQFLATTSQLSPISAPPSASHQSLGSVAETSGSHALPSVTGTTATSDPPPTSDTAIPSLLQDLLSRLHLLLSSEAMSHLRDGFSRYPWALHLLESWSDKSWNWSYFVIFARVLCILQTTAAADLSEALCAELSSSLSTLGNVGFDANWIAAVHTRIRDCQASLANLHEAKALRATKDGIAGRLAEFEFLVDAIRTELAGIDLVLADYAHKEELARNVIGLP